MIDCSKMSIMDLEQYKETLLNQKNNLDKTIRNVVHNIQTKKLQTNNETLRLNPYYKDKKSYLKVNISDGEGYYIVTRIIPCGTNMGISQCSIFGTSDFLKSYDRCSKSEWESVIDRLNIWFKDSGLKIENLDLVLKE